MTGVLTFPNANQFNIDNVSISLTNKDFSDKEIIHIFRNEDQLILVYRGLRATVSELEAQKLNKDLGIQII
jgi:hypothetical protein